MHHLPVLCRSQSQYVELQIVDNVDTDLAPEISCWLRLGEGAGIYSITLEAVIEHHKDDPIKYQQRCRAVRGSQPSCPHTDAAPHLVWIRGGGEEDGVVRADLCVCLEYLCVASRTNCIFRSISTGQ